MRPSCGTSTKRGCLERNWVSSWACRSLATKRDRQRMSTVAISGRGVKPVASMEVQRTCKVLIAFAKEAHACQRATRGDVDHKPLICLGLQTLFGLLLLLGDWYASGVVLGVEAQGDRSTAIGGSPWQSRRYTHVN